MYEFKRFHLPFDYNYKEENKSVSHTPHMTYAREDGDEDHASFSYAAGSEEPHEPKGDGHSGQPSHHHPRALPRHGGPPQHGAHASERGQSQRRHDDHHGRAGRPGSVVVAAGLVLFDGLFDCSWQMKEKYQ